MGKNYFTDEQIREIYYSAAGDSIEIGAFEFYKGLFNKAVETAIWEAVADALEELERALCLLGVVGNVDGHDVIRRDSVINVARQRIKRNAKKCE